MLPIFEEITEKKREALKARIDAYGRKEFAAGIGESYMVMSNRLNGHARFQVCVGDFYDKELARRGA